MYENSYIVGIHNLSLISFSFCKFELTKKKANSLIYIFLIEKLILWNANVSRHLIFSLQRTENSLLGSVIPNTDIATNIQDIQKKPFKHKDVDWLSI